ncbi:MAG: hypothetical protein GXO78_01335 [Calditrichaeota bacterium]|nr:hypothetical protein [Calditrichota bacterium]
MQPRLAEWGIMRSLGKNIIREQAFALSAKKHILTILVLVCGLVCPGILPAQTATHYELQLVKDNISWLWLGGLHFQLGSDSTSKLLLENRFSSHLYRAMRTDKKWKDDNALEISWQKRMSPFWDVRTRFQSKIFSDENTFVKFSKHYLTQEVTFRPRPEIAITPAAGWAVEDIFGIRDQGFLGRLNMKIRRWDMGGYLNDTDFSGEVRAFPGRRNQEMRVFTSWQKQFSPYARDSIRVGYQFTQSRYYLPNTQALEQVLINARFLENELHYQTSPRSQVLVATSFRNRDIDQSNPNLQNRRKEIFLGNHLRWRYQGEKLALMSGISFSQTIYDNPDVQTDLNALQTTLSSNVTYRFRPGRLAWLRFSYTKFEYNTPDTVVNHDDRDELRFIVDAAYLHRFHPDFTMTLQFNTYLYHQIYIHPSRSANNNWNRIFQLRAAFRHRLNGSMEHRYQLKILANYTVFDFDELFPVFRSYIFRKLIFTDSLSIQLSPQLSLKAIYQLEKEDNGTFFKNLFAQQVTKELTAHFINVYLEHRRLWMFQVLSGITIYRRDEWRLDGQRRKIREFRSLSPRLTVIYRVPGSQLFLYATYAPTNSTNFGQRFQYFHTGTIQLRYRF